MRVYSAFDGCSGLQQALKKEGFKVDTYLASEIDKYAMAVTRYNFPETRFIGDINSFNPNSIKDIDLMVAGSPCQDVSFSGLNKGLVNGDRSNLFFKWVEHLNIIQPKYFILENVRMKQEYQDIISEKLGVKPKMLPSSLISAQKRDRFYWTNIDWKMPEDKNLYLKDVLECDCCNTDRKKSYCIDANYFKGGNLKSYFEKRRRQMVFNDHSCHQVGVADLNGHDILKRVYSPEGKAPTVTSMGGGNREPKVVCGAFRGRYINGNSGKTHQQLELRTDQKTNTLTTVQKDNVVVNPEELYWRKLTVKETERLQMLPDDYTLFGDFDERHTALNPTDDDYFIKEVSNTQRYKMIGNGFCITAIQTILRGIK